MSLTFWNHAIYFLTFVFSKLMIIYISICGHIHVDIDPYIIPDSPSFV